jgi:hypothetical protein
MTAVDNGYVYAIGARPLREVKIGWSAMPSNRLSQLQTGNHQRLEIIGQIAATESQEIEIHQLLWRWRLYGEWFRYEGAVVNFVAMLPTPPVVVPRIAARTPDRIELSSATDVIEALGGVASVAEMIKTTYRAAHNWKARDAFPAHTYVTLRRELEARGYAADDSLWGQSLSS